MKKSIFSLILAAGLSTSAFAGTTADVILNAGSAATSAGAAFDSAATFDNIGASDVDGWSFGVCHDTAALTLTNAAAGASTIGLNGGGALGFESIEMPAGGYTVGVVIDFFGANKLAPGTGYELMVGSYTNDQAPMESTTICFCDTLGAPPVETVIVIGGGSVTPTQNCGTVDTMVGPVEFSYNASSSTVNYDPSTGVAASGASSDISILENPLASGPYDTQGFSIGLGNDSALLTPTSVDAAAVLNDLNGGMGPSFTSPAVFPDGATLGVVYQFLGGVFIVFDTEMTVATVNYDVDASSLMGDLAGTTTPLDFNNNLGMPPVENVVVVNGASLAPDFVSGAITLQAVVDPEFVRGDCNGDGIVNIADGIWILNQLFQGGSASSCTDACDVNDDASLDSSDAVYIFSYRFMGGAAPAAPFPSCDTVAGADCDDYSSC